MKDSKTVVQALSHFAPLVILSCTVKFCSIVLYQLDHGGSANRLILSQPLLLNVKICNKIRHLGTVTPNQGVIR